ncbi:hypothetical protein BKA70DRAFT_1226431 [Coprinopsis sp. MPI-PUGE-AT-0042]|nr:hypothetical protein BKA70DRAFT_1226431 [Coprinopsis sp. MPI-PUGE-AT-0042]
MLAAYGGHEAIVRLLLDAPHTTTTAHSTNDGHTAISLALSQGHDGIVQLLEEFEYRRERSDATGLSLGALVDLERLSSKEAVGESVSEYDSEGSETYYDAEEQLEWEEI